MRSPLSLILGGIIKMYRRYISPLSQPKCKFYPTCSTYSLEAISVHGGLKGLILASWRLLRCHPWSIGGVDYVPLKGSWKQAPYYSMTNDQLEEYWKKLDGAQTTAVKQELIAQQTIYNFEKAHHSTTPSPRSLS